MTHTPGDAPHQRMSAVLDEVDRAVVGKREQLSWVLAALVSGGHVLLEDLPGLGKTLAARSLATALGLDFVRAQFTPDLLPSDLTGSHVFDQRTSEFDFRPGPVFTGLLLADEINRTPPKTQSALLEAMQERQVTVDGTTFPLAEPFHVIATANPIEHEGTYPLPEAQLDRFALRISFGLRLPTRNGRCSAGASNAEPSRSWCDGSSERANCSSSRRPSRRSTSAKRWGGTSSPSRRRRGATPMSRRGSRPAARSPCWGAPGGSPFCGVVTSSPRTTSRHWLTWPSITG